MKKRLVAALIGVVLLLGLVPGPVAVAAGGGSFHDITDPTVAEAAELLRLLGVVDGTASGVFNPGGSLTRAEFCKLAVEIMGRGDEEPAQRNRTIFLDVGPDHWARGYVNLASSITLGGSGSGSGSSGGEGEQAPTGDRLIMGVGNGRFEPDRAITYGEAVAMLVRILGYSSADVVSGVHWYDGYLGAAHASGLTKGLSLSGDSPISRGQAALLFRNMLFTRIKGGSDDKSIYLISVLGGSIKEDAIVLSMERPEGSDATAVVTSDGTYQTYRTDFPTALTGVRGDLVLDKQEKVLTILPKETDTIRRVSVMGKAQANLVPVSGGEELSVTLDTVVWKSGENQPTTYEKVWTNLYSGTPLVICSGSDGKVAYIYMASSSAASENVMVAWIKPNGTVNPFGQLIAGDKDYQIYKNGAPATVADLRQYDVATYDRGSRILQVSDLRITGRYENASPNPIAPSRITILGADLTVLPGAVKDLSAFKPGDSVTLLLTSRGEVAGAVDPTVAKSTVVGVVKEISSSSAKVEPLISFYDADGQPVVFTGNPGLSESRAKQLEGQLVTLNSSRTGQISLSKLSSSGTHSNLDVINRTLGNVKLSENVALFERVGNSVPGRITFDQITRATIPSSRILYAGKDSTGKISILVFNDVTGDQYTYGFAQVTGPEMTEPDENGNTERIGNPTVSVVNSNEGVGLGPLTCGTTFRYNEPLGIAASIETLDGNPKLAGSVSLTSTKKVSRASFDMEAGTVTVGDQIFPISKDVVCYNRTTGIWFEPGLAGAEAARAYAEYLTVYYDKSADDGGKIRIIVVE